MKASIVIPTKDKLSRLRAVLKGLENQITLDIEVIVVFDGCEKFTLNEFDNLEFSYKPEKVVCDKNVGRAAARNVGIKRAKGDIIIFIDDDRIPCKDFIKMHLENHKKGKTVVLGGRIDVELSESEIEGLYHLKNFEEMFEALKSEIKDREVHKTITVRATGPLRWMNFFTGNVSIEKTYLEKVGGFDENFKGWGHEDIDLGIRLAKEGLVFIKNDSIPNYHLLHESNFVDKKEQSQENMKYMLKKYKRDALIFLVLSFAYIKHGIAGLSITAKANTGV